VLQTSKISIAGVAKSDRSGCFEKAVKSTLGEVAEEVALDRHETYSLIVDEAE